MTDVSVIICAHNPRSEYLQRVLNSLRAQTLPTERWELLLVDNISQQPLADVWDLSWHPHGRHFLESELGLSAARIRGMEEARTGLLVFVDDDNVLEPNYLEEATKIRDEWPKLGVWGSGAIVPEFEVQPSPYVSRIIPYLALREVESPRWGNMPSHELTPWGAGLVIRKTLADIYCKHSTETPLKVSGRKGLALLSGEDVELSYLACSLGMGIGIFPQLRLTHLIAKGRVEKDYLLRIVEGTSISNALLARKWKGVEPRSPMRLKRVLSIAKHLLLLRGIDRAVYWANVRATIKARRIIAAAENITAE